jgi:Putative MetA-pathway of phenol degradation
MLPAAVVRFLMMFVLLSGAATAAEEPPPIQDNSFLLEEAYNQEEGVVQHINAFQRMRDGKWTASFTQEWPVPRQAHQFSYTIPYQRVDSDFGDRSGIGDIALNYRYQLADSGDTKFACTPRMSLLLPTGDDEHYLGAGGLGVQLNVAASVVLSKGLVAHTNVGGTYSDSATNERGDEASIGALNAGQSFIWQMTPVFNVMLETIWLREETVVGTDRTERKDSFFASPGIRWAHNLSTGLQIVPGIAFPLGLGSSRHERSVLLYLSFEHPMWRPR